MSKLDDQLIKVVYDAYLCGRTDATEKKDDYSNLRDGMVKAIKQAYVADAKEKFAHFTVDKDVKPLMPATAWYKKFETELKKSNIDKPTSDMVLDIASKLSMVLSNLVASVEEAKKK